MNTILRALLASLTVSTIIVLAAGNFTGGLAYLERHGRITYLSMTSLGRTATTVRAPGTFAVHEFIAARHAFISARVHNQDRQERYSALSFWLFSTVASITVYTVVFYTLIAIFGVVRRHGSRTWLLSSPQTT
jgi:hypothetical protein